jgi:hypothetical protein
MEETATSKPRPDRITHILRWTIGVLVAAIAIAAGWLGLAYAFSPGAIRTPHSTHYHFRLQVINNGTPVNFASAPFQESEGTVCSVALTAEPIHFHDNLDQFVHIHWDHLSGGILLKNYGWNFIGGPDDTLGYRFDQLPRLIRVPIHARALPTPPKDTNYYVYTGNADSYQQRQWNDFLSEDFRDFFVGKKLSSIWDRFIPTATAHGDDEKLTKLNDVLGNVVIFAQKTKPTDAQIKDRFNHLVPLPESTCGG